MTGRPAARMPGGERGRPETGAVRYRPMYARVLGLRHLRPGGMLCFAYLEGTVALSVLLALAELVSWWVVLILPVSVALMVKVNDLVAGAVSRSAARTPERERELVRREVSAFMPMVGRAKVVTPPRDEPGHAAGQAGEAGAVGNGRHQHPTAPPDEHASAAAAGRRDTTGRYTAEGRHHDAAWPQHAYAATRHTDHAAGQAGQRDR